VSLLAPTGKAARRLAEVTGAEAQTIHRALGVKPNDTDNWEFEYNAANPLGVGVVIVDETSMVDVEIASALLQTLRRGTRVFFVGDADQLPSVGPGQFFRDLIDSGVVPVVRLEHVHRAAAKSWVCRMAPEIREGRIDISPVEDFEFVEVKDSTRVLPCLVEYMKNYRGRLSGVQVLIPQNAGPLGVEVANVELQNVFNPKDREFQIRTRGKKGTAYKMREADRVICIKNDYTRSVFNGDSGVVSAVTHNTMVVAFDTGSVVDYTYEDAQAFLRLSYAVTIHKYQGSEQSDIVVVCHDLHHYMWTRRLLYTAVTRARRKVHIIGTRSAIKSALRNTSDHKRCTTLRARLQNPEVT